MSPAGFEPAIPASERPQTHGQLGTTADKENVHAIFLYLIWEIFLPALAFM